MAKRSKYNNRWDLRDFFNSIKVNGVENAAFANNIVAGEDITFEEFRGKSLCIPTRLRGINEVIVDILWKFYLRYDIDPLELLPLMRVKYSGMVHDDKTLEYIDVELSVPKAVLSNFAMAINDCRRDEGLKMDCCVVPNEISSEKSTESKHNLPPWIGQQVTRLEEAFSTKDNLGPTNCPGPKGSDGPCGGPLPPKQDDNAKILAQEISKIINKYPRTGFVSPTPTQVSPPYLASMERLFGQTFTVEDMVDVSPANEKLTDYQQIVKIGNQVKNMHRYDNDFSKIEIRTDKILRIEKNLGGICEFEAGWDLDVRMRQDVVNIALDYFVEKTGQMLRAKRAADQIKKKKEEANNANSKSEGQ